MSTIAASMLAGAGIGLTIAVPIGPTSMLCIQRTLAAGLLAGLSTGLGVATVHLSYGILAAGWGTAFAAAWSDAALLSLASGLVLLAFSVRVLRHVPVPGTGGEAKRTFASAYCEAVGFGFLNPLTPILFAATTPSVLGHVSAPVPALVAGIFLGSLGWWIALITAVSLLRRRVTFRSLNLANKVAGLLMAVLAVGMLGKGAASLRPSSPDRGAEPIEARHEDPG